MDPNSPIEGYRYTIGTTPGGTDIVNWTNSSAPLIVRSGLSLQRNQRYFITVRVRNQGGLWSLPGISNAIENGNIVENTVIMFPCIFN